MDRVTQQWKGLENTLNDKTKKYIDKVNALVSAWENFAVLIVQSSSEATENSFTYVHKYTLQLLLHGEWPKLPKSIKSHFTIILQRCLQLVLKFNIEIANRCRSLISLVHDPWQHPTLHKILHNEPTVVEEVSEFFEVEGSQLLIMRIEVLCEGKCEDLALSLAESCFRYLHHSNVSQPNHINYIRDILLALLFRFKRNHDIIAQLQQLDLGEGLHLVQRYAKRSSTGARIWKHCDKVTEIAAHTILTSAMVQCVEDPCKQQLLYDLIKEWALIHVPKLFNSHNTLQNMVRKIIQTAESSLHIYIFCKVLKNEFGDELKSLCVELYIRGITTNMNEVEQQKMKKDKQKIYDAEIRLSDGFLQLADILQNNISVCRECVLTAFSLNPTKSCLDRIKALAIECGICLPKSLETIRLEKLSSDYKPPLQVKDRPVTVDTGQEMVVNISSDKLGLKSNSNQCPFHPKSNNNSIVTSKGELCSHCGEFIEVNSKLGDTNSYNTLNILNPEALGLAQHLCDDLATVLSSPRHQMLSWSMDWTQLSAKCENYLEEHDSRRNATTELKFLNIDYSQYGYKPTEEEDTDISGGIEKGYEHWIECSDLKDKNLCSHDILSEDQEFNSRNDDSWAKSNKSKKRRKKSNNHSEFIKRKISDFSAFNESNKNALDLVNYELDSHKFIKLKNTEIDGNNGKLTYSKIESSNMKYSLHESESDRIANKMKILLDTLDKNKVQCVRKNGKDVASLLNIKHPVSDPSVLKTLRMYRFSDNSKTKKLLNLDSDLVNNTEKSFHPKDIIRDQILRSPDLNPKIILRRADVLPKINGENVLKHCQILKDYCVKQNKLDILAQAVMRSDILLANSVPGLNSLDMIIPETPEPTIQVVQLPNNAGNTIISQHSVVSSSSVDSSSHTNSIPRAKPATDTVTTQTSDVLSSTQNNSVQQDLQTSQAHTSTQVPALITNTVSPSSISFLSNSESNNQTAEQRNTTLTTTSTNSFAGTSSALTSMLLNISRQGIKQGSVSTSISQPHNSIRSGIKQSPATSSSTQVLCSPNQVLTVSNQLMQSLISANQEGSTQVSAHIQRVGHPIKTTKSLDSSGVTTKPSSSINAASKTSEEVIKTFSNQQNSVFRLIVKDGRVVEQYFPQSQTTETNTAVQDNSSVTAHTLTNDQLLKLIKSKKDCKSKQENLSQSASLPKFHHAFGRQMYQTVNMDNGDNMSSTSQYTDVPIETMKEGSVNTLTSSALSKAVQTALKDNENNVTNSEKSRSDNEGSSQGSTANFATTSKGTSPESKINQENRVMTDIQATSSVIFTCKVPTSTNNLIQGKPVTILKTSQDSTPKFENESRSKESVIRSNMNALLAAALQSPSPLRSSVSTVTTSTTVCQSSPVKVTPATEPKKASDNTNNPPAKIRMPSPTQKTVRRPSIPQQNIQRFVRPLVQVSTGSSTSNATPVVPCIPLPLRTVQVLATNLNPSGISKVECRRETIAQNTVVQNSVSSTTLEQLREFESVLEQVTNTSQMKERGNVKLNQTEHHSVLNQATSSSEFSSSSQKPTTVFPTTVANNNGSDVANERVSLTFISKSATTLNTTLTSKITTTTPVVVVQSCSRPVASPALSVTSQSSTSPVAPTTPTGNQPKISAKVSKPKTKPTSKTTPTTSTLKISTLPKPQQKPQEDEQTTQRIYAILDKYAEQLRNSPELKNKPAPRRRSNPPTSTTQSSKRKKSSQSKSKSTPTLTACTAGLELSPGSEDVRTLGSEDSSNGQISQVINSPQSRMEELSTPTGGDISSETSESLDAKDQRTQHRILLTDTSQSTGRTVIVQENIQPTMINVESSKVLAGKQVVVGGSATVPLTLSLPGTGNLKQVIFPVPADGRQFVVAKVPKMYRVHQVTGSPLLAATGSGAVVLRQMCLNKSNTNVKQVKVPVVSTISSQSLSSISTSSQPTVVLPSGTQSFTLATSSGGDADSLGISLDNTILLNTTSASSIGFIQRGLSKTVQQPTLVTTTSTRPSPTQDVTTSDETTTELSIPCLKSDVQMTMCTPSITLDNNISCKKISSPSTLLSHSTVANKNWSQILTDMKVEEVIVKEEPEDNKMDVLPTNPKSEYSDQKDCGTILSSEHDTDCDSARCKGTSDSVIKHNPVGPENGSSNSKVNFTDTHGSDPWHYVTKLDLNKHKSESSPLLDIENKLTDTENCPQTLPLILSAQSQPYKRKLNNVENTIFQIAFRKIDKVKSNHIKEDFSANQRSTSALERELRLQKSLSEECEDLGVDKPSTSDLFPEAELLLDPDPLSRDSLPGELFSRGLESSSSSHDSPSRSPVLGNKFSSHWKKQKRSLLRHKVTSIESLRWDSASPIVTRKPNTTEHKSDSSRGSTPVNGGSAPSNFSLGSDCKDMETDSSEVFRRTNKHCEFEKSSVNDSESHCNSGDTEAECNDSDEDNCGFSEVEDNCNDTDIQDTEGDSDSASIQQCPDISISDRKCQTGQISDLKGNQSLSSVDNHVIEPVQLSSSPKCLPPLLTYNKRSSYRYCTNFLSKDSSKLKSESDLTWYKMIKGASLSKDSDNADSDVIDAEINDKASGSTAITDESGSDCPTPNGLQTIDESSNLSKKEFTMPALSSSESGRCSTRKRKCNSSQKGSKSVRTRKGKRIGVFVSSPGEDSGSSADTLLLETESCTGHRSTRRSSTRGLIKKGCPCLNGSPEPSKKKKETGLFSKSNTPNVSPNTSLPISTVNKKPVNINKSCLKSFSKKR